MARRTWRHGARYTRLLIVMRDRSASAEERLDAIIELSALTRPDAFPAAPRATPSA
jgi:hypothetical protein